LFKKVGASFEERLLGMTALMRPEWLAKSAATSGEKGGGNLLQRALVLKRDDGSALGVRRKFSKMLGKSG
jgi:hypothetical protein